MAVNRLLLLVVPALIMLCVIFALTGVEQWLAAFAKTESARQSLGKVGIAAPYVVAGAIGIAALFAAQGSANIRSVGWSVFGGAVVAIVIAAARESRRLSALSNDVAADKSITAYLDSATLIGAMAIFLIGCFALRAIIMGNAAFASGAPRRIAGMRFQRFEVDVDEHIGLA